MIPAWLHSLSIAFLLLGLLCAVVIVADLVRHKQHMWIMNVVWPVTALFGTVWIVWQYFTYGRLAEDERAKAAMDRDEEMPSKKLTPFPVMVANGALHCGSGCTLGDIMAEWLVFAVPAIAVWFGWHSLFGDKIFAAWIVDYLFAYAFGIVFQYFTIAPMRNLGVAEGIWAAKGRHLVANRMAGRHVRVHGLRLFLPVRITPGDQAGGRHRRVLVHDTNCHDLRLRDVVPCKLVADPDGPKRENV